MATEYERKFVVTSDGWRQLVASQSKIAQGYLSTAVNAVVRVRRDGVEGFLTIKGPQEGHGRPEFEYEISDEDVTDLLTLALGRKHFEYDRDHQCLTVRTAW